jgi:MFS family permease
LRKPGIYTPYSAISVYSDINKTHGNLKKFHGEASSTAVENATASYQAPSLIAAGSDAHGVALLTALINLFLSLVCAGAPAVFQRIGATKKGIVILSRLSAFTWLPLVLVFLMPAPAAHAPLLLALLWLVSLAPAVLLNILRDSWLANLIPDDHMGRYLGERQGVTGLSYLGTFLVMGRMLDGLDGRLPESFSWVFAVSLAAAAASAIIFSRMHNLPVVKDASQVSLGLKAYLREMEDVRLRRFVMFTSLFAITASLCGPLYAVYMLNNLGLSYSTFAVILAAEYATRLVSAGFWGRLADRLGNIRVIRMVTPVMCVLPALWLISPGVGYLIMIQALAGACWGAYDLCCQGYTFQLAPVHKKLLYVIFNRSAGLICAALGGLLSFSLLGRAPALAGSGIFSILVLSAVLRLTVTAALGHKLQDSGPAACRPQSRGAVRPAFYMASRRSPGFGRCAPAFAAESAPIPGRGLFSRPGEWPVYLSGVAPQVRPGLGAAKEPGRQAEFRRDVFRLHPLLSTRQGGSG